MRYSTRIGLRVGILFGLFFGFFQGVMHGFPGGVLAGLLGGAMFGLIMAWMLRRKERIWATLAEPYEAEGIVHRGPANCAIGPGYLLLTTKRLVWLPQIEKQREKKIIIAREAISQVKPGSGLGAQVRVDVYTGESVQFLVSDRKKWLELLKEIVAAQPPKAIARIRES